jgi:glycine dehydrogenase subunit 2
VYFPLVIPGALMIEPTETEPIEELDRFVSAMENIADMSRTDPEKLQKRRVDGRYHGVPLDRSSA